MSTESVIHDDTVEVTSAVSSSIDWSEVGAAVVETTASFLFKGWADGGASGFVALGKLVSAVKLGDTPAEKAWRLTALSFAWAVGNLRDTEVYDEDAVRSVLKTSIAKCKDLLENNEFRLPATFLERPTTSPIYQILKSDFLDKRDAFAITSRLNRSSLGAKLDIAYNRAIFEVWSRDIQKYEVLKDIVSSPGIEATIFDLNWSSYRKSLVHSFEVSPVFGQDSANISLSQVYIPLRGFWNEDEDQNRVTLKNARVPRHAKIGMLDDLLDAWIDEADEKDWLRLIGGGPGSGKSTTLKALARRFADQPGWRPLFIPLQNIGLEGDLRDSINKHFADRSDGAFTQPPLSRSAIEDGPPLLLIFDGLDELAAPNDAANEVINTFAARLTGLVAALKGDGSRKIRVVVSGRMPAFQAAKRFLAPVPGGSLEAFGYLPVSDRELVHQNELWSVDQRSDWWKRFALATGENTSTPPALEADELAGITHEPLLCYLLVLAGYATKDWEKAAENPNRIYSTLMSNIYERGWGEGLQKRHGAGKSMSLPDFLTLMETIGLAAWLGGDARVATEGMFHSTLPIMRSEAAWEAFNVDNGPDVTNLAMNFYLKAAEGSNRGFEFTHKSFGEYLAAKALLAVAFSIDDLVERRRADHAMRDWFDATRTGILTTEIITFMRNEVRLQLDESDQAYDSHMVKVKRAFEIIAQSAAAVGFASGGAGPWRVQELNQKNAEFAVWAVINSCARALGRRGRIAEAKVTVVFQSQFELRNLIARHTGVGGYSTVFSQCLSYLEAPSSFLFGVPINGGDFEGANLMGSIFDAGRIYNTSFRSANISHCSFHSTHLSEVNFAESNLERSYLYDCRVTNCDFTGANADLMRVTDGTVLTSDQSAFEDIKSDIRYDEDIDREPKNFLDDIPAGLTFLSELIVATEPDFTSRRG